MGCGLRSSRTAREWEPDGVSGPSKISFGHVSFFLEPFRYLWFRHTYMEYPNPPHSRISLPASTIPFPIQHPCLHRQSEITRTFACFLEGFETFHQFSRTPGTLRVVGAGKDAKSCGVHARPVHWILDPWQTFISRHCAIRAVGGMFVHGCLSA